MGAERLWDRFIPATFVTKPLSCGLNFIVRRMGLWEQARARLSSHRGTVDQEGWDEVGRRALGRTDWVHVGRMCPGQAAVIVPALLHLPMQGPLALLPRVPGHLQNRPDKTFMKLSCLKESGEWNTLPVLAMMQWCCLAAVWCSCDQRAALSSGHWVQSGAGGTLHTQPLCTACYCACSTIINKRDQLFETPNLTCREVLANKQIRWFYSREKTKLKKVKAGFFLYQIPSLLEQQDFLIVPHTIFLHLLQDCKNTMDPAPMKYLTSAE